MEGCLYGQETFRVQNILSAIEIRLYSTNAARNTANNVPGRVDAGSRDSSSSIAAQLVARLLDVRKRSSSHLISAFQSVAHVKHCGPCLR